ncbi:MAG: hypothetical protein A4E26_00075 [Methanobacterium sp. PtaU1.Bin097]|nr:MAG: hypothetical protein A4E26_00075 [Methanobacterium sp. PtaU1.Bin097]
MKELHEFILNSTTSRGFFDEKERPYEYPEEIELRLWHQLLNPCGMPRWYLNHFIRYPENKRDEVISICLEENLIHPILAMEAIMFNLWDVLKSLFDLQGKLILRSGKLMKSVRIST